MKIQNADKKIKVKGKEHTFNWINEKYVKGVRHILYRDVETGKKFVKIGEEIEEVKTKTKTYWLNLK